MGLFSLELTLFWPGILRVDSIDQINQALSGTFNDHHPPLMGLYWAAISKICAGPGGMLVTHLLLFWGSIYNFTKIFQGSLRFSYLLIGLLPPLVVFHPFILKDIGFAHCYFFAISCLTRYTIQKEKPSNWSLLGIFVVLFYGTAVKFQGIFILPILSFWIGKILYSRFQQSFAAAAGIFALLYATISIFNTQTATPSNSWQYVKLYDLTGISLRIDQPCFPAYITQSPNFNMQHLKELYTPKRVDDLVFAPTPVLAKAQNDPDLKELWSTWMHAVLKHPMAYFQHRFDVFLEQINCSLVKAAHEIKSRSEQISPRIFKILNFLEKWNLIQIAKIATTFSFFLPFMLVYFLLGIQNRYTTLGQAILFMNGIGLMLLGILFFFSMAAEARYIYLTIGCFHFSHPLVYALLQGRRFSK